MNKIYYLFNLAEIFRSPRMIFPFILIIILGAIADILPILVFVPMLDVVFGLSIGISSGLPDFLKKENEYIIFLFLTFIGVSFIIRILFWSFIFHKSQRAKYIISYKLGLAFSKSKLFSSAEMKNEDFNRITLNEVDRVVDNVLLGSIIVSYQFVGITISIMGLLYISGVRSLFSLFCIGLVYIVIFLLSNKLVKNWGTLRISQNVRRFSLFNDLLLGVKELKIFMLMDYQLERFKHASENYARAQSYSMTLGQVPKIIIETLMIAAVICLGLVAVIDLSVNDVVEFSSVFAIAALKILPGAQVIFNSINNIRFSIVGITDLRASFNRLEKYENRKRVVRIPQLKNDNIKIPSFEVSFNPSKRFSYSELDIPLGKMTVIAGKSGSGKSSYLNCIAGFHDVIIKKEVCEINMPFKFAYLSQNPHIFAGSVKDNLNMFKPDDDLTKEEIHRVLKFVELAKDQSCDNILNREGDVLSLGEKQRLALARCLLNKPSLLILDEFTSGLDDSTQKEILKKLRELNIAILTVAHRSEVIDWADKVVMIDEITNKNI